MWPAATNADEPPTTEKTPFTFSTDAGAVVLYVNSMSPMMRITRSMAAYGDRRIELREQYRASDTVISSYDVQVDRAEMESLLRIAVDHGLVDWDPAAIRVRQKRTGRPFKAGSADSPIIDVIIALKTYGERQGVGREIQGLRDLRTAKILYPEFPEYKGLDSLLRYMSDAYRQAENKQ